MLALIDGDVIIYRCGWASEEENEAIACVRANKTIEDILHETGATTYQVWLSDSLVNNFRLAFYPEYKANRKDQPKPKHYDGLRLFLKNEWDAQITLGQEADDILGIMQTGGIAAARSETDSSLIEDKTIICSNDKDLLQVPGKHFNFVRKEFIEQTYFEGLRYFYSQSLVGDRVDNIIGVKGIGPVFAERYLRNAKTEKELYDICLDKYQDKSRLDMNLLCLWVRREPGQIWKPPIETELQNPEGECSNSADGHSDGIEAPSGSISHGGGVDSVQLDGERSVS